MSLSPARARRAETFLMGRCLEDTKMPGVPPEEAPVAAS